MYASRRFTTQGWDGNNVPVMASATILPSGQGAHAISLRLFDGPAPSGRVFAVRMTPAEARKLALELMGSAETLSPVGRISADDLMAQPGKDYGPFGWQPLAGYERCANSATIAHAFEADRHGKCAMCGVMEANALRFAERHWDDKHEDPGHGKGSECVTCLDYLAHLAKR